MTTPMVPISWGELIDKITILEIKSVRIASKEAVANVRLELDMLNERSTAMLSAKPDVVALKGQLTEVNEALWEIEDKIRDKEAASDFGAEFIGNIVDENRESNFNPNNQL